MTDDETAMTDDELAKLLREARPAARDGDPRRDAWPLIEQKLAERTRWLLLDVALATAAAAALLIFPEWLVPLAYHL